MAKKKKLKILETVNIREMDILTQLKIFVTSIFVLSTLSFILIFITGFVIPAVFILISYFMIFVLMVKLLTMKKL